MPRPTATLFAPSRLPPRDEYGHVIHPDMPQQHYEDDWDLQGLFGVEEVEVCMDAESLARFLRQNSDECGWWTPAAPKGGHWRLAYLLGSGSGPESAEGAKALFVRHPKFADRPSMTVKEYFVWDAILANQRRRLEKKIEKLTDVVDELKRRRR